MEREYPLFAQLREPMTKNNNGLAELEKKLWSAADELRANSKLKSSEYSVPVLGMIFLRYADFRFSQAEKELAGVESSLGRIPEGWNVKALGDLISVNALSISPKTSPEQIKYIDIASVSSGKIEKVEELNFLEAPGRARRIVKHSDVITPKPRLAFTKTHFWSGRRFRPGHSGMIIY